LGIGKLKMVTNTLELISRLEEVRKSIESRRDMTIMERRRINTNLKREDATFKNGSKFIKELIKIVAKLNEDLEEFKKLPLDEKRRRYSGEQQWFQAMSENSIRESERAPPLGPDLNSITKIQEDLNWCRNIKLQMMDAVSALKLQLLARELQQ